MKYLKALFIVLFTFSVCALCFAIGMAIEYEVHEYNTFYGLGFVLLITIGIATYSLGKNL